MDRVHSIDAFRGVAIIAMVFFSVTLRLSSDLPEPLRHNVPNSLHLGDLVLPMFLFASGLSLAYYLHKRELEQEHKKVRNVFLRFGKLALVGVSLSFFSANGFFEMDEVMLNALLFIACVALSRMDWKVALAIMLAINLSYIALIQFGWVTIFSGHYLGGYPAALYYLPIMLTGLIMGNGAIAHTKAKAKAKANANADPEAEAEADAEGEGFWCRRNIVMIGIIVGFLGISLALMPVDKMAATPSYIMVALMFSILVFALIERLGGKRQYPKELEYIGRKPLRYWLTMYIAFIIPARVYIELTAQSFPLHVHWPIGIVISLGLMLGFWGLAHILDLAKR